MSEKVSFTNDRDMTLKGLLDGDGDKGVVLVSHFTGFKEFKHLHSLAKALEEAGYTTLRFDFSDCIGESEGKCEDMALTHQVRDVGAAMDFLEDRGIEEIGLMGHSLGGTTAIVAAANDERPEALVTAAPLAKLEWDKVFSDRAEQWKEQGYITFDTWKGGEIRVNYSFYTDLKGYDATELIQDFSGPLLLLQPEDDELVAPKNAEMIYEHANDPKSLQVIEGADHMFSGKYEDYLVDVTVDWFEKWM